MTLVDALASDRFVVTAELGAPLDPDPDAVRATARVFAPLVDAANITDNQAARAKMSALACASLMLASGLDPIMQLTARDRNLLALQSELLGAWALGVRCTLALGGDPLTVGPYETRATEVRDVDTMGLISLMASLNAGRTAVDEELGTPTGFRIAAAMNPFVDTLERLEQKLDAGASVLQTNIVYDVDRFAEWFGQIVAAGIAERAPVLVGVTPPRSERMLRYLHERIPGVEVDAGTFARMLEIEGDAAKAEGIAIAGELISSLREIEGVAGVHIMAPGWELEAVPLVVEAAGLAGSRSAR